MTIRYPTGSYQIWPSETLQVTYRSKFQGHSYLSSPPFIVCPNVYGSSPFTTLVREPCHEEIYSEQLSLFLTSIDFCVNVILRHLDLQIVKD